MKTVRQVSQVSGISVRTLHHYDAIGLLKPTKVTEAGYRLYDAMALQRLQNILMFRELEFPLKEIKRILDNPGFDQNAALEQQIGLLELQKAHIEGLIVLARDMMKQGVNCMNFSAFDRSALEQYAAEAKNRWGSTEAYRESREKSKNRSQGEQDRLNQGLMECFSRLGALKDEDPASEPAQALVQELMQYITDHYYTCTPEILSGLGQMYVCDERFQGNIDQAGGQGTADFANRAIQIFAKK